jgi:hypothetical protein
LICRCVALAVLVASPLFANDEREAREDLLKQFFEGRMVTVRIDMPATAKGIDIHPAHEITLEEGSLGERISQAGIAIREGARVPITKVHFKGDLIEFQLAGGGFNWVWDTQGRVSPETGKSARERDLERRIHDERDPDRRRELEAELRDARHDREWRDRYRRETADAENSRRDQQDHERALYKGSRFNLRWDDRVPPGAATPDGIMELLSPWVDFTGLPGAPEPPRDARRDEPTRRLDRDVQTGMSWAEVQDRLGEPDRVEDRREGDLRRSEATYESRGLELTFVNDVLVHVRQIEVARR